MKLFTILFLVSTITFSVTFGSVKIDYNVRFKCTVKPNYHVQIQTCVIMTPPGAHPRSAVDPICGPRTERKYFVQGYSHKENAMKSSITYNNGGKHSVYLRIAHDCANGGARYLSFPEAGKRSFINAQPNSYIFNTNTILLDNNGRTTEYWDMQKKTLS